MWVRRAQHDIQVNTFLSRQLGVDEDADGILCCYGRLEKLELSDDERNQFYLLVLHRDSD